MKLEKPNNKIYSAREVNKFRFQSIIENAGESILDVGCGNGQYVLKLIKEHNYKIVTGVDYQSFEGWEQSPENFAIADAFNLPFPDNSFDTICLFEVLEHLPQPEKALTEFYRVCKKNIILTVPNCEITKGMQESLLTYYHYTDSTHVNFFTLDDLAQLVDSIGFKVTKKQYINNISFLPLIYEGYNIKNKILQKAIEKSLKFLKIRNYFLTNLIVAEK